METVRERGWKGWGLLEGPEWAHRVKGCVCVCVAPIDSQSMRLHPTHMGFL